MPASDFQVSNILKVARGPFDEQIKAIHRGIPRSLFAKIAVRVGLRQDSLAKALRLNDRTLRNRTSNQRLNRIESEKSFRVARVFGRAVEVLGSEPRAREWINSPIKSLDDSSPVQLLDTDVGTQEVLNTLNAIEWGVYL